MFKQSFIIAVALIAALAGEVMAFPGVKTKKPVTFKVRVENVSDPSGLMAKDGSRYPFALSPGLYVVSKKKMQLFRAGSKADRALEAQAEDGDPGFFYKRFLTRVGSVNLGVFNKPVGNEMASPILPGGSYEFTVTATEGMKLNLVMMYGQSNDLFYAPDRSIELFDPNGDPVSDDITAFLKLWDAGTELNQAPGLGADQGPRQKGPNTGTDEMGVVRLVNDGFSYPDTKSVLRVTVTAL